MIQTQMINALLATKDASVIELNNLTKEYFSEYKREFSFIKNHYDRFHTIPDKETFAKEFPDFEWIDVKEPAAYLVDELFEDYKKRQLITGVNEAGECLMGGGDSSKAANILKERLDNSIAAGVGMHCPDLVSDTSRECHYLEKTKDLSQFYLTTGFPELDRIMGGIDKNEELGVIIARTNYGKSWLAIKMASAAVDAGLKVGFYSGEMSVDKVGYRFDTMRGHIPNGAVTHGNINVQTEYKNYIESLSECKGHLYVLTPQAVNGPVGVGTLRAFIERYKLDILFIDQIPLLKDDRNGRTREEKLSNIIVDLKNLQTLKHMPIINVTQQNRQQIEGSDSIDTIQIAGSDDIGKFATFVIGVGRDKKDETIMTLQIVKSRDSGGVGKKLQYKTDLNRGLFTYIPGENDSPETLAAIAASYRKPASSEGDVF